MNDHLSNTDLFWLSTLHLHDGDPEVFRRLLWALLEEIQFNEVVAELLQGTNE